MNTTRQQPVSEQGKTVDDHYSRLAENFYMAGWNRDHLHCGLFESGNTPRGDELLRDSPVFTQAVERMVDVTVEPARIEISHQVVDAGCGMGGTAIRLAKTYGCSVTGIDLHRSHLERAREKAIEVNLDNQVGFEYADCSKSLPFADGSIDVVANMESACHYSNRGRFFCEVSRILKPGGRLWPRIGWRATALRKNNTNNISSQCANHGHCSI